MSQSEPLRARVHPAIFLGLVACLVAGVWYLIRAFTRVSAPDKRDAPYLLQEPDASEPRLNATWTALDEPIGSLRRDTPGLGFFRDGDRLWLYTRKTDHFEQQNNPIPFSLIGTSSTGAPIRHEGTSKTVLGSFAVHDGALWAIETPLDDADPVQLLEFDRETLQLKRSIPLDPTYAAMAETKDPVKSDWSPNSKRLKAECFREMCSLSRTTLALLCQANRRSKLHVVQLNTRTGKIDPPIPMDVDPQKYSYDELKALGWPVFASAMTNRPIAVNVKERKYALWQYGPSRSFKAPPKTEAPMPEGFDREPTSLGWMLHTPPLVLRQSYWYAPRPKEWENHDHAPRDLVPWREQAQISDIEALTPQTNPSQFTDIPGLASALQEVGDANKQTWIAHGNMAMQLFGVGDNTALVVQLIDPVSPKVAPKKGILRLGIIDVAASTLDWIGFLDPPAELKHDFELFFTTVLSVEGDTTLLGMWLGQIRESGGSIEEEAAIVGYYAFPTPPALAGHSFGWMPQGRGPYELDKPR